MVVAVAVVGWDGRSLGIARHRRVARPLPGVAVRARLRHGLRHRLVRVRIRVMVMVMVMVRVRVRVRVSVRVRVRVGEGFALSTSRATTTSTLTLTHNPQLIIHNPKP